MKNTIRLNNPIFIGTFWENHGVLYSFYPTKIVLPCAYRETRDVLRPKTEQLLQDIGIQYKARQYKRSTHYYMTEDEVNMFLMHYGV